MRYSDIFSDYRLFAEQLEKDCQNTMRRLYSFNYDDIEFLSMDNQTIKKITRVLSNNGFHLTKKLVSLIDYNPLFLISSLEYDYYQTIKLLCSVEVEDIKTIKSFDNTDSMLSKILKDNNFVLNKKNLPIINYSPVFLLESLKNDLDETYKCLNNSDLNFIDMDIEAKEKIINLVLNKNELKFAPPLIANILVSYISDCAYDEKRSATVCSLINKGIIPVGYVPFDFFLENGNKLAKIYPSNIDSFYIGNMIIADTSKHYYDEYEKKLLEALPNEYKKCKSVEDVIGVMLNESKSRYNVSLIEMYAMFVYTSKNLNKNGIFSSVNVSDIDLSMRKFGANNSGRLALYINGNNNSAFGMISTLNHEMEHSIQDARIRNGDIVNDYFVDMYSKDYVLKQLIGDEYYKNNYSRISFETMAEYNGLVKTFRLMYKDSKNVDAEKKAVYETVVDMGEKGYQYGPDREYGNLGDTKNIHDLFEEEMNKCFEKDEEKFYKLLDEYPIIKYEYNYNNEFERKSIRELVRDFENSNGEDKKVYHRLLLSRVDANKEDEEDIKNNVEEIKQIYNSNKCSANTKKVLSIVVGNFLNNKNKR